MENFVEKRGKVDWMCRMALFVIIIYTLAHEIIHSRLRLFILLNINSFDSQLCATSGLNYTS
jgi:hypothetical protein